MKMNQPIGQAYWAPLLVRLPMGIYFIMAGWGKLSYMQTFTEKVKAAGVMPDHLAVLYASLLPYVELVTGTFLIIGIWTTLAAILASLMLLSFILALGIVQAEGHIFNKDILIS